MKDLIKEIVYIYLITATVSISFVGMDLVFGSDQRTYLAFDGLEQKSLPTVYLIQKPNSS